MALEKNEAVERLSKATFELLGSLNNTFRGMYTQLDQLAEEVGVEHIKTRLRSIADCLRNLAFQDLDPESPNAQDVE